MKDQLPQSSSSNSSSTFSEMSMKQVQGSAAMFAKLLSESRDEHVLKESCLGLCQLFGEGIQNDRIQSILEANVVPRLVNLLQPIYNKNGHIDVRVSVAVQSAALQVIGNIACGDDRQTQVIIDCDALPCLKALLGSPERGIRKECCWIISNITESAHQVHDVIQAGIIPALLKLLESQDATCREDATWVLYNITANRDPEQIRYLAENNGIRALCNLLTCTKELDVIWKGCGSISAVALKGIRNVLVVGEVISQDSSQIENVFAAHVAEAHGVERIEALTNHKDVEVRARAHLILRGFFHTENNDYMIPQSLSKMRDDHHSYSKNLPSNKMTDDLSESPTTEPRDDHHDEETQRHRSHLDHNSKNRQVCNCHHNHGDRSRNPSDHDNSNQDITYRDQPRRQIASTSGRGFLDVDNSSDQEVRSSGTNGNRHESYSPASPSSLSVASDNEDDSDADLIPSPPPPCNCVLCSDFSPLNDKKAKQKSSNSSTSFTTKEIDADIKPICDFCSGSGRLGDGRAGLAAKLGRAVRIGHSHCLAVLLYKMSWNQRSAATEAPALLHPGFSKGGNVPMTGTGPVENTLPAVVLAAQLGKPECLALLIKKCRPDLNATYGKKKLTSLAWASHKGYLRCCEIILAEGADPSILCTDGLTALHLATSGYGNLTICRLLLEHGALVNARSNKGQTALCLAAQKGHIAIVDLLHRAGANVNNEDEQKFTPLHLASLYGHADVVGYLLAVGAVPDAKTLSGVTPLHYAVQGRHIACVRILLKAGVQVQYPGNPLMLIASDNGDVESARELLQYNASIDCRANIKILVSKDYEMMDYLSPLLLAASKGHTGILELLLDHGADINDRSSKGWSPLDYAVFNGHVSTALCLLNHGCIVDDKSKICGRSSWTLVQYAAHSGNKDLVRLLVQRLQEQKKLAKENPESVPPAQEETAPLEVEKTINTPVEEEKEEKEDVAPHMSHPSISTAVVTATERLEEAMAQQSAAKLIDAIAQANKLVLQMVASSSADISKSMNRGMTQELSLGTRIIEARKILAVIQLEEKRAKDQRAMALADAKRDSDRKGLKDVVGIILNGGDPRTLNRAINKATRNGLGRDDPVVLEAEELLKLISDMEALFKDLAAAEKERDVTRLKSAREKTNKLCDAIEAKNGANAINRIAGMSIETRLEKTDALITEITKEIDEKEQEESSKRAEENIRMTELEKAVSLLEANEGDIANLAQLERAIDKAAASLFTTSGENNTILDNARKLFRKSCKNEKRILKQLLAEEDLAKSEKELERFGETDLKALATDIREFRNEVEKLRSKEQILKRVERAIAGEDIKILQNLKSELDGLGLFDKSSQVRNKLEYLQKQERAKTLLEHCMSAMEIFSQDYENLEDLNVSQITWPDGCKLNDLIIKAERFQDTLQDTINKAVQIGSKVGELCRKFLKKACESRESRIIASSIISYRKSFCTRRTNGADTEEWEHLEMYDREAGLEAIKETETVLAKIQVEEQEKVLAESEKLKHEAQLLESRKLFERASPSHESQGSRTPRTVDGAEGEERFEDKLPVVKEKKDIKAGRNLAVGSEAGPKMGFPEDRNLAYLQSEDLDGELKDGDYSMCAHYYLWLSAKSVVCAKCGNERISNNSDWIDRVKRRTTAQSIPEGTLPANVASPPLTSYGFPVSSPVTTVSNTILVPKERDVLSSQPPVVSQNITESLNRLTNTLTGKVAHAYMEPKMNNIQQRYHNHNANPIGYMNMMNKGAMSQGTLDPFHKNMNPRVNGRSGTYVNTMNHHHPGGPSNSSLQGSSVQNVGGPSQSSSQVHKHLADSYFASQFASNDISRDFAKENFGFDIDSIVEDELQ